MSALSGTRVERSPGTAPYWPTAIALLGLLLIDGALVASGAFDSTRWRSASRLILALDALALAYWLLLHPFVRRWYHRSPY